MTRYRRSRLRKRLELLLLLVGVACLGVWGWSVARESLYQDWNNWAFDRHLSNQSATVRDYVKERMPAWLGQHQPKSPQPESVESPRPAPPIPDNGVVGRIRIPRLGLSAMVRQGTGAKTLDIAVGHIPGTALPGGIGNVAVAGHRDTLFRGLRNIKKGDLIDFETLWGKFEYRVESMEIVTPQDVSVLNAKAFPELTLVTCYPFTYIGAAPNRYIVKAVQLSHSEVPPVQLARAARPSKVTSPPVVHAQSIPSHGPVRVAFEISRNHSRQLAPGISIGLTETDPIRRSVTGWMWVMPERRTIWLRDQSLQKPVVFYEEDDKRRELTITSISGNTARGYLLLPANPVHVRSSSISELRHHDLGSF